MVSILIQAQSDRSGILVYFKAMTKLDTKRTEGKYKKN